MAATASRTNETRPDLLLELVFQSCVFRELDTHSLRGTPTINRGHPRQEESSRFARNEFWTQREFWTSKKPGTPRKKSGKRNEFWTSTFRIRVKIRTSRKPVRPEHKNHPGAIKEPWDTRAGTRQGTRGHPHHGSLRCQLFQALTLAAPKRLQQRSILDMQRSICGRQIPVGILGRNPGHPTSGTAIEFWTSTASQYPRT